MSNFQLIKTFKDGPVQYEDSGKGHIKMVQHAFPYSLKEREFDYLTNLIIKHDLKAGYECATAFGVSTMACALGFKVTRGKLVTMDAYIEEENEDPEVYKNNTIKPTFKDADGYKSVNYLIEKFRVEDIVFPEVGWSPDNTSEVITKHFGDSKLDFVFLDAGHFPEQMIKDIDSFIPFLGEKYVIAFHDNYPWSFADEVHQHLVNRLGKDCEIVVPHPEGENLSVLVNV